MKNTHFLLGLLLSLFAMVGMVGTFTSCSDDDYGCMAPMFSDITIRSLSSGSTSVKAGERFVLTAVKKSEGKNVYGPTFEWTVDPQNENVSSVWPKNSSDPNFTPTDTLVINAAGTYTITFIGKYRCGGSDVDDWTKKYGTTYIDPTFEGTSAKYTCGASVIAPFTIELTKKITIMSQED